MRHGPERTQAPGGLRRSETAGDLMQFIQAINWMPTSLPELVELEAPLRRLLEECLCNTRGNICVAARRVVVSERTDERAAAWDAVRLRVRETVPLDTCGQHSLC